MPVRVIGALGSIALQEVCAPFMMAIILHDFLSLQAIDEQFSPGKDNGKGKKCLISTDLSGKTYCVDEAASGPLFS